jgi:hypothetical protein
MRLGKERKKKRKERKNKKKGLVKVGGATLLVPEEWSWY